MNQLMREQPRPVSRSGISVPVVAANNYRPVLEHIIPAYKDDGALHLDRLLGQRLAASLELLGAGLPLVPVPSTRRAVRQRGYDHCARIVRIAAARTATTVAPILRRSGAGRQRIRNRTSRIRELRGTMRAKPGPARVILVDDVVTTGSSLIEATRALNEARVSVEAIGVIANADRLII